MIAMTPLRLGTHGKRFAFSLAGTALAATAFLAAPHLINLSERAAVAVIETPRPAPRPVAPRVSLPFTMSDVVAYFADALMMKPDHEGGSVVFAGSANGHAEDVFRIAITPERQTLVVAFSGGGDYGVTLAREFFEARFFTLEETLRFFTLLDESRDDPATAKLRRFTVRFDHLEHSDDFHLTLRFSPAGP